MRIIGLNNTSRRAITAATDFHSMLNSRAIAPLRDVACPPKVQTIGAVDILCGDEITFELLKKLREKMSHHDKKHQKSEVSELPSAQAVKLDATIDYAPGAIVSKTIAKTATATMTLFAFDAGQGLSEHSAPFDAYVMVLDGSTRLTIGGEKVTARAGETVRMPANIPHAVHAPKPFKMLLLMLRE